MAETLPKADEFRVAGRMVPGKFILCLMGLEWIDRRLRLPMGILDFGFQISVRRVWFRWMVEFVRMGVLLGWVFGDDIGW